MSKVIQLPAIANEGRFGNRLIHYLVGKCYAESIGATVEIPKGWIGETLFEIDEPHITTPAPLLRSFDAFDGTVALPPFFNMPHRLVDPCLTRPTVHRLFKWKPGWVRVRKRERRAIHVRRGDFLLEPDFPVVSKSDMRLIGGPQARLVSEDAPTNTGLFPKSLSFLEDFQTLMLADDVFVYPRSTFSQMAALLGNGNIYMPFDYRPGPTTCKFRMVNPEQPVIFPTKNNSL